MRKIWQISWLSKGLNKQVSSAICFSLRPQSIFPCFKKVFYEASNGYIFCHPSHRFSHHVKNYECSSWLSILVKSELPNLDLISSPSPSVKIQIVKITENLGFESPLWKVKIFFVLFLFIFKKFTQNWVSLILTIFWYLVLLFRNQIKHVENVCFYWYLICKKRY